MNEDGRIDPVDYEQNWESWDAYFDAASAGDVDGIRRALTQHPERLHKFDMDMPWSALHHAAAAGHVALARLLLDLGADVNATLPSAIGPTPLDEAVENHRWEMVDLLLDSGANPSIPTWMWLTAIDRAIQELRTATDQTTRDAALRAVERLTDAARRFPPPEYPDGTRPERWPPDPNNPDRPKRVPEDT